MVKALWAVAYLAEFVFLFATGWVITTLLITWAAAK